MSSMSITNLTAASSHGSNFSRNTLSLTSQSMNSITRTQVMSELDSLMMNHHMHQTKTETNNEQVVENSSVQFGLPGTRSGQNTQRNESYPETTQQPEMNLSPLTTAAATLESAAVIESDGEGVDEEELEEGVNLDLRSSSSFTPWHTSHALSFNERGSSHSSSTMHKTPAPTLPPSSSSASFLQWKAAQQASAAAHRQQHTAAPSPSLHTPLSSSGTRSHPFHLTVNTASNNSKEEEEHRWDVFLRRVQRQVRDRRLLMHPLMTHPQSHIYTRTTIRICLLSPSP